MGRLVSITFRGEDHDVEIDHDSGYEFDTGAHDIEWHFYGLTVAEAEALHVTDAEEGAIFEQLAQRSHDYEPDDYL